MLDGRGSLNLRQLGPVRVVRPVNLLFGWPVLGFQDGIVPPTGLTCFESQNHQRIIQFK